MRASASRRLLVVVGFAIVAGAAIVAPLSTIASETGPTYTLADFRVVYPYDDPRRDVPPSADVAAVSFEARWPDAGFPGRANCRLTLRGSDGAEVGHLAFELINGTDGSHAGPMIVFVSSPPASASGSCEDDWTEMTGGSGYLFSGPTSVRSPVDPITGRPIPGRSEIEFDVAWEHRTQPGLRTCVLSVRRTDGSGDAPREYGMLVGEGPVAFDVEGTPETVAAATVTCGPFNGQSGERQT